MEIQNILLQSISYAASKLKDSKLSTIAAVQPILDRIAAELGFEAMNETIVFIAILDRQCGSESSDIDDLSNYFEITSLDTMRFVPAINSLIAKGFVAVENRNEVQITKKNFIICREVFNAIIEGNKVTPTKTTVREYDQFDFCTTVRRLIGNRSEDEIETAKLFSMVADLEAQNSRLSFVADVKAAIGDIESRTLFYKICFDYSRYADGSARSNIEETLDNIYDRIIPNVTVKEMLELGTHPLITARLIRLHGSDYMKLSDEGVKLLFGNKAEKLLKANRAKDRYDFVSRVEDLVDDLDYNPSYSQKHALLSDLCQLEEDNEHLPMIANLKNIVEAPHSRLIFYLVANEMVDGDTYSISSIGEIAGRSESVKIKKAIKSGEHILIKRGLVEVEGGGIFDGGQLSLTYQGKKVFLEEDIDIFEAEVASKDLIYPGKIAEKQLFFDDTLDRQLTMLRTSLQEENYAELTRRLNDKNLAKGVAVLLYGNPGTGKTESVMQIARQTGRAIMHVDISATKTCWFGESEKLIKEVFTKYRTLCAKSKLKPILLFNEADAVFSKRKDSNSSSVAQTENAIQNIILEEMERLDGILIATTNLADNLDKAFERRFLFKIRFDRPSIAAKRQIWQSKLPSLTVDEATTLASQYDFSGGEIDNIARKVLMDEIIQGHHPTLAGIMHFCSEEKITHHSTRVGF